MLLLLADIFSEPFNAEMVRSPSRVTTVYCAVFDTGLISTPPTWVSRPERVTTEALPQPTRSWPSRIMAEVLRGRLIVVPFAVIYAAPELVLITSPDVR